MKKLIAGLFVSMIAGVAMAATDIIQYPMVSFGTPTAVTISSSVYTNATPVAARISGLTAVLIDVPSTNSNIVHGHLGNCTSTAISTSTVKGPIEIAPSAMGGYVALAEDICLWMVTRNTSGSDVITVQGVSQRR